MDVTPGNLWQEIQAGEEKRDDVLRSTRALRRSFYGEMTPSYENPNDQWPEAVTFEYLAYMVPRLVSGSPKVRVQSSSQTSIEVIRKLTDDLAQMYLAGMIEQQTADEIINEVSADGDQAKAIQHALNYWIEVGDYRNVLDVLVYDYLFSYAVTVGRLVPMADDEERRWPVSERIDPERFCLDPQAQSVHEAKWMGHWSIWDVDDLGKFAERNQDDGWKPDTVRKLQGTSWSGDVKRNEVRIYEIWVRDHEDADPAEGMHGGWHTIAAGRDEKTGGMIMEEVREPRAAYCPPWGPYTLFGSYVRPDSALPLSPLQATYTQQREFQLHSQALNHSARDYKRILLVSDKNPKLAQIIQNSPDAYVHAVADESFGADQIQVVEVGGITDQQLSHYEHMKMRLDRQLGMDDAQRGIVRGDGTATEHSIADSATQTRVSYIDQKFADGVRRDLRARAWYMMTDERVQFSLGDEVAGELDMLDPEFVGGLEGDRQPQIDKLMIEIEPYSMERTSEALLQRNVMTAFELIANAAPQMLEMQHIDWRALISKIGDSMNMRGLDDVVRWDQIEAGGHGQRMLPPGQQQSEQRPQVAEAGQRGQQQAEARRVV